MREFEGFGKEAGAGCERSRGSLRTGDQLKSWVGGGRFGAGTDGETAVGAEGDAGEVVDGDRAGGDEDGVGFGEFVEEGEEFEFDLDVVGQRID